jgi:prepilin-type N-terminal cleavage/methylation domain-containing protein
MKKAFTVIELLVVIAIGVIFVAIISPVCSQLGTSKSYDEKQIEGCQNPDFQQAIVTNEVYKTYIYKCDDGHIIELNNKI